MSLPVLFVCTGNICRSPLAERLLLARARPGTVEASSAGTYGLPGHTMDAAAAQVARELGADPDGHVAREITELMVVRAHLVLTATVDHRDAVLRRNPRAMRRTFTLREFVRLGADLPPMSPSGDLHPTSPSGDLHPTSPSGEGDLDTRIAAVAARRGQLPAPGPGADDIGDPFGGPLEGMRTCGAEIATAVDGVLRILGIAASRDYQG